MIFEIIWTKRSFNNAGEIIKSYPNRQAEFSDGLKELALELSNRPAEAGESRPNDLRIGFFGPFVVYFSIHDRLPLVTVHSVHLRSE